MAQLKPEDLAALVRRMKAEVPIKDRKYRLKTYKNCFVGNEAVAWMVKQGLASSADDAVALGNSMMQQGRLHHVVYEHSFKNKYLFYRFDTEGEKSKGWDKRTQLVCREVTDLKQKVLEIETDLKGQRMFTGVALENTVSQTTDLDVRLTIVQQRLLALEKQAGHFHKVTQHLVLLQLAAVAVLMLALPTWTASVGSLLLFGGAASVWYMLHQEWSQAKAAGESDAAAKQKGSPTAAAAVANSESLSRLVHESETVSWRGHSTMPRHPSLQLGRGRGGLSTSEEAASVVSESSWTIDESNLDCCDEEEEEEEVAAEEEVLQRIARPQHDSSASLLQLQPSPDSQGSADTAMARLRRRTPSALTAGSEALDGSDTASTVSSRERHGRPRRTRSLGLPSDFQCGSCANPDLPCPPPRKVEIQASKDCPVLMRMMPGLREHRVQASNPQALPINTFTPVQFDTPLMRGRIAVFVRGLRTEPPGVFDGKRRKSLVCIQGKFKQRLSFWDVLTGTDLKRPAKHLPPKWLVDNVLTAVAQAVSPSLRITSPYEHPTALAPLAAIAQHVHVARPGQEPDLYDPPQEDMSLVDPRLAQPGGGALRPGKRRAVLSSPKLLKELYFDTENVWTFQIYQHVVDLSSYRLEMGYHFDISKYLDGQPMQVMAKVESTGEHVFGFEIWHEKLLDAATAHYNMALAKHRAARASDLPK